MGEHWEIIFVQEVHDWYESLMLHDMKKVELVDDALELLQEKGPSLRRPIVDTISGSNLSNLKELRPGSSGRSEIRLLFVFDPQRQATSLWRATSRENGTSGIRPTSRWLN
jgi:hypothetical protein